MKVLEIIASLDVGGAETALANRLAFQPDHVTTTVLHGRPMTSKQVSLPNPTKSVEASLSRRKIREVIAAEEPDVVVIHNPITLVLYPRPSSTGPRPSVAYVAHGATISEHRWKEIALFIPFRFSLNKATKKIVVSRQAASQVGKRSQVHVVHLGSQLSTSAPEADEIDSLEWLSEAKARLLVMSRLSPAKNLSALLHAVADTRQALRDAETRLLIVGDGSEKARLVGEADRLQVLDLVRFSPTTKAPAEYMRRAHYLVISSLSEGGPLTAYEAIMAGANIVSTKVGAVPDIAKALPHRVIFADGTTSDAIKEALVSAVTEVGAGTSSSSEIGDTASSFGVASCSHHFYDVILRDDHRIGFASEKSSANNNATHPRRRIAG